MWNPELLDAHYTAYQLGIQWGLFLPLYLMVTAYQVFTMSSFLGLALTILGEDNNKPTTAISVAKVVIWAPLMVFIFQAVGLFVAINTSVFPEE